MSILYVYTFTIQKLIVFEIDSPKNWGAGNKNLKKIMKNHKARVGYQMKGNFNHNMNIVFVFENFKDFGRQRPRGG